VKLNKTKSLFLLAKQSRQLDKRTNKHNHPHAEHRNVLYLLKYYISMDLLARNFHFNVHKSYEHTVCTNSAYVSEVGGILRNVGVPFRGCVARVRVCFIEHCTQEKQAGNGPFQPRPNSSCAVIISTFLSPLTLQWSHISRRNECLAFEMFLSLFSIV
jgi:hypothetical protein